VTLKFYINENPAGMMTWTENKEQNHNNFYFFISSGSVALRTPTLQTQQPVQPELSEVIGDYDRITMENYDIEASTEDAGTAHSTSPSGTYTGVSLNKTYLDVDVKYNDNYNSSNYFHFFGSGDWADNIRFQPWAEGTGMSIIDVNSRATALSVANADMGITNGEFFNVKILTDIAANASDATKEDVTLKFYINENPAGMMTWTENKEQNHNNFYFFISSGSVALRTPTTDPGPGSGSGPEPEPIPELSEALEGYTRVTINDFEGLAATTKENGTKYSAEATGTYKGESLNKTYLDVDINLNGTTTNYLHFLAEGAWANYKRISWSETGLLVWDPMNAEPGSLWAAQATYGIETDKFFNVKLRTDIKANALDTAKEDVTLQLWINDTYVGERTWTEATHARDILYLYVGSGSLTLRTPSEDGGEIPVPPSVEEALQGYTRVTPTEFAVVGEVFTHGWIEGNWMGYEYPESLNHAYLDIDLALCSDMDFQNSIRYLSSNGWESVQIGIVGEELLIFETSTNTVLYRVALSEAGIKADEYFNLKLSSDITQNANDNKKKDMVLRLWINNVLVSAPSGEDFVEVKGCAAVGNMLGIYLPNEGTIKMKTPQNGEGGDGTTNPTQQPDSSFKKITFGNFAIQNGKYSYIGAKLGAEGSYIFNVNETVFSGNFHFSKEFGADFRYGGNGNPWNGLRFWTTGDGKLYMQDATEKTEIYTFHPMYAKTQLVDNTFNMKLSVEFVDSDGDKKKDDVKLGVWFNDVLYKNEYIYLKDYAKELGNMCSVYVQKKDAWIQISSDSSVYVGVDFTLFGFTRNWKKELGIK
ncbi:MAG: hypothetical protein Q4B26_19040, partial [Eubacteriales bacterium]|nr:hypothetical protein [Eubacteriales bacterium]